MIGQVHPIMPFMRMTSLHLALTDSGTVLIWFGISKINLCTCGIPLGSTLWIMSSDLDLNPHIIIAKS